MTVLDVRPSLEYRAGHIPGARSVPVSELQRHGAELPKNRGNRRVLPRPNCVMAIEAVELLRKKGFRAHAWRQGVMEWRHAVANRKARGGDTMIFRPFYYFDTGVRPYVSAAARGQVRGRRPTGAGRRRLTASSPPPRA